MTLISCVSDYSAEEGGIDMDLYRRLENPEVIVRMFDKKKKKK